jgi:hypothetical protein
MSIYRGAGGAGDATADSASEALLIRELAVEVQADADAASASATTASTQASNASTSASNASTSASNASTSATNASNSATSASGSASTATTQASNASTSATAAAASASAASGSASTATTQASNASTSATTASTSATNAANSATTASTQASNASSSASAASTSATNAASSATSASGSASTATTQASNASTSATNAAASATSATNSASTATTQAGIATTQATNAATSATTASTQASNASTSATNAAASATSASNSASTATTQASNASTSASNAATSATNAANSATLAASYTPSQTGNAGKYLKTDGTNTAWDALDISTSDISGTLPLANGGTGGTTAATARTSLGVTATGADTSYAFRANNLSDLTSASTARTNLGLGTAATTAASDYLTASNPNYTGTLTGGTGIVNLGSGQFYKDASGLVGIGTSSPSQKLTVAGSSSLGTSSASGNTSIYQAPGSLYLTLNTNGTLSGNRRNWAISPEYDVAGGLSFSVGASEGASPTSTKMIITSSGNVFVGASSQISNERFGVTQSANAVAISASSNGGPATGNYESSDATHATYWTFGRDNQITGNYVFAANGTTKGSINLTTGVYTALSDSRVKKDITNMTYGLNEVLAMRPVTYLMKEEEDTAKRHLGFIAQEIKAIIDESVDDLIDEEKQMYGLDKSGLVPVLVKAIQELNAKVTALEAQLGK